MQMPDHVITFARVGLETCSCIRTRSGRHGCVTMKWCSNYHHAYNHVATLEGHTPNTGLVAKLYGTTCWEGFHARVGESY